MLNGYEGEVNGGRNSYWKTRSWDTVNIRKKKDEIYVSASANIDLRKKVEVNFMS